MEMRQRQAKRPVVGRFGDSITYNENLNGIECKKKHDPTTQRPFFSCQASQNKQFDESKSRGIQTNLWCLPVQIALVVASVVPVHRCANLEPLVALWHVWDSPMMQQNAKCHAPAKRSWNALRTQLKWAGKKTITLRVWMGYLGYCTPKFFVARLWKVTILKRKVVFKPKGYVDFPFPDRMSWRVQFLPMLDEFYPYRSGA